MKKWIIKNKYISEVGFHTNPLIGNLLLSRGINTKEASRDFLCPDTSMFYSPFLLTDMKLAIEKIDSSIQKREKITIYGDYDVDGITSTSILCLALKKIGADVGYYIPDRMSEGYGINKGAIEYLKSIGTKLVITVDCGISAMDEVEYAKSLGIEMIITDHHECRDTIPKTIVISPKRKESSYPFKELAGCGVAFKLVQALWENYELSGCEEFLDIVAIGTVADIVDLKLENRIIVKYGLKLLDKNKRCGINALKVVSGIDKEMTSYNIAFQLAPRINAAGRLSDAKIAVELFTTTDNDKALQIAKYLDNENKNRQKIEDEILNDAVDKIVKEYDFKRDRVIVLSSPNWHSGVVGIVASRIVERYNRPVILIAEDNGIGKGSGRSIEGFNLFENICKCSDLLLKYGGHELAAGLTIETNKIEELKNRLNELAFMVNAEYFQEKIYIDIEVTSKDANIKAANSIKEFEPFGAGNPSPVLCMEGLNVISKKGVGNKEQHLRIQMEKDGNKFEGIMFKESKNYINKDWKVIDTAFNMDINEWNNNKNLQFILKDIKPNKEWIKENIKENYYRYIKNTVKSNNEEFDFKGIIFKKKDINFLKEFSYFKRGYILVSGIDSINEIDFLFDFLDVNFNNNSEFDAQIIICPDVSSIDTGNNDILIYDFLPGEYEYSELYKKAKGSIYNFYDEKLIQGLEKYIEDICIDKNLLLNFQKDLMYNGIVGSIKEVSKKYSINIYKGYKLISFLKERGFIDVFLKGEILKIEAKKEYSSEILFDEYKNDYIEKVNNLKNKFATQIKEDEKWI